MAKGLIVWGSTAMLAGWACGVFGLLGVRSQAEAVNSWPLNLGGLALCLLSLCTSLLLRPTVDGGGGEDGGGSEDGGGGEDGSGGICSGGGALVRPTMLEHQRYAPWELRAAAEGGQATPSARRRRWTYPDLRMDFQRDFRQVRVRVS